MATHTNSGGENYGRKFSISRKNGQVDKDGRPYFFEWVKEIPNPSNGREFETRSKKDGTPAHYELFGALDGFLTGLSLVPRDFGNGPEPILCVFLSDGGEDYTIEIGRPDHRYSMDFLKRILDPNFNPAAKLRLSPYSLVDKQGKTNMGISTFSGANKLLASRKSDERPNDPYNPNLEGIPQATSREWKGKTEYDFTPVSEWLLDRVNALVVPRIIKDPVSQTYTAGLNAPTAPGENDFEVPAVNQTDIDLLPF